MLIAVGSDHAGFPLKSHMLEALAELGAEVKDFGSYSPEPVDFPDIARLVCDAVRSGQAGRGIMICGTGVGAAIAANKIPGIRAAVGHDIYSAAQCVEHDDVNVLCIGAQVIGPTVAAAYAAAFLSAEFSTETHFRRRVEKLRQLERTAALEWLAAEEGRD
ncbi:ribose 5-phosphate isomerase B [Cohnella cellulosilytica]|uniref:Ribose 5-phosphate isomerase B n=1 Tax=Cohnella cellulosilytica TaxID=986710 RepID=A0ABW2F3G3_9BACL